MALTHICDHCGGSGRRQLTDIEAETLARLDSWRTVAELAETLQVEHTALCNRLSRLHRAGLVERRRVTGCQYTWRLVPQ